MVLEFCIHRRKRERSWKESRTVSGQTFWSDLKDCVNHPILSTFYLQAVLRCTRQVPMFPSFYNIRSKPNIHPIVKYFLSHSGVPYFVEYFATETITGYVSRSKLYSLGVLGSCSLHSTGVLFAAPTLPSPPLKSFKSVAANREPVLVFRTVYAVTVTQY